MRVSDAGDSSRLPPRPYIPPSAAGALAACASASMMLQGAWTARAGELPMPWASAALLIACGLACFAMSSRAASSRPFWRWMSVGLLLGCVASALWLGGWQRGERAVSALPVSAWWLVAVGDPTESPAGFSSTVELRRDPDGPALARARATSEEPLEAGDRLRAVGRFEGFDDSDWARGRFMRGEVGSVRIVSVIERGEPCGTVLGSVRRAALAAIGPAKDDARALLAGTICGRTTELSGTGAYASFRACGLTHLVAVSGSHLAFIAALLEIGLRALRLGPLSRRASLLAVMACYVVFTGASASALRSVSMVGLASVALLGHRRAHAPSGLALTVLALVACDPGVVYDLGFQLSALSVLFMLIFSGYVTRALESLRLPHVIAEPLALSMIAQWATMPLTLPLFGELSLVSPLANIVVGPCMTALLAAGLACVAASVPLSAIASALFDAMGAPVAEALLFVPLALARASIFLADILASIPYACVCLESPWWLAPALYTCAVALYLRWPQPRPKSMVLAIGVACLCVTGVVVRWVVFAEPSIVVLDVGQGDAILIRDGPRAVLVDAGVDDATRAALARNHVFHLDAVIITHWDADHWGGLPELMETVPVDGLVVAQGASAGAPKEVAALGVAIVELSAGDSLRVGGFSCDVAWPRRSVGGGENEDSLVLTARYDSDEGSLSVLLTGDTERDELERYAAAVGDVDVLKMGHHGSARSVCADALEILRPEVAVASAGEGNAYGHPDPESVEAVEAAGATFACTIEHGDVSLLPGAHGPRVRLSR